MPVRLRPDDKPVVEFDPRLEISPFRLFRQLDEGAAPLLVDVRRQRRSQRTLRGAEPLPAAGWQPPPDRDVVLFDDDGSRAVELAARYQADGHRRVRALFGGLALYAFSLDPEVVGKETFLIDVGDARRS